MAPMPMRAIICAADRLTDAQKGVVASIFAGATTSTGALVYASFPWDSGVSGSGKSSLVRAGLIPALRGGAALLVCGGCLQLIFQRLWEN